MTDLRTAAQQALEALEYHVEQTRPIWKTSEAIAALEAALAEPCPCGDRHAAQCPGEWEPGCDLGNNPKYAKRVEMTPKELAASIKRGEKWKVAEPVQEPVAIVGTQEDTWKGYGSQWLSPGPPIKTVHMLAELPVGTPLYTAPPQRKPEPNSDYERGFVDGMSEQARRSVDKAVNAMTKCKPLAEEEIARLVTNDMVKFARAIERAHGIGGSDD